MNVKTSPLISIITATYNSMKYFEDTKKSVLEGDVEDFEWIIVDDGSTDGTRKYLQEIDHPNIKLHFKSINAGIEDSYRTGIELATGKYLLILDHDDTIPLGSLSKRLDLLESNPNALAAFGAVAYMDESGRIYKESRFPFVSDDCVLSSLFTLFGIFILPVYPLKQGCVVLRSSFVKNNPGLYDIQLFLQAAKLGPVIFIKQACLNYRTFRTQFSSSRKMRLIRFFQFVWAKYAFKFLPWYISPFFAIYKTIPEFFKVLWSFVSSKRI
ncbi:glycosyltransferase family 2 protein [Methylobacillus flagellatus]|uniref:Glycosyl transferase, family 2 n=1 Tax=Methylobacillus flagellatus (strain ATCC 51484 / DSM 6875 / VKM B-1610 / KT) TaxID=265072 RepID=Q1GZQ3_METFK|nr:glycosyltransferase family 2 protein [Methylobacillus flagellatus]ABE50284.1 glycosyl transferase, family 2 [Methylobacillus flagellatus KT]